MNSPPPPQLLCGICFPFIVLQWCPSLWMMFYKVYWLLIHHSWICLCTIAFWLTAVFSIILHLTLRDKVQLHTVLSHLFFSLVYFVTKSVFSAFGHQTDPSFGTWCICLSMWNCVTRGFLKPQIILGIAFNYWFSERFHEIVDCWGISGNFKFLASE